MATDGDTAFEVEFADSASAKNRAIYSDGNADLACLEFTFARFPNFGLAKAYARRSAHKSIFRSATIARVVYRRGYGWDTISSDELTVSVDTNGRYSEEGHL